MVVEDVFNGINMGRKMIENLGYKLGDLPVTEAICDTIFNLPCYAEITQEEQDYIVNLVFKFYLE